MLTKVSKIKELKKNCIAAIMIDDLCEIPDSFFSHPEKQYVTEKFKTDNVCTIFKHPNLIFIYKIKIEADSLQLESSRKAGSDFFSLLKKEKSDSVQLVRLSDKSVTLSFLEGFLLSSYTFSKYKKKKEDYLPGIIYLLDDNISDKDIGELKVLMEAVFYTRNLVNEPLSFLNANRLSEEIEKMGSEAGFTVDVFNKKKIEALRMGGLLAVNRGSPDPPTFNILEWKPEDSKNLKPVILVGKGVVFDTGGLSLKPTHKSMDYMKSDMSGGAVVAATIYAIAKNQLPLHVIGLIPATDNRPDGKAYVPGDIITMYDGTTVEVRNTDAEGRLILADALSYAKKYEPSLVIDVATLTGSASIIAGRHAVIAMGNSPEKIQKMMLAGEYVFERLIEVPLWEEFSESLKSTVADLNNLGDREAQTSIAGKFLEHFTDYPWIHLDIASVAYYQEKDSYRPAGGTGYGTRLLYNFLKKFN
jgi:leucyl aminopeptidase